MKIPKLPFSWWFLIAFSPLPGLFLLTLPWWGIQANNANGRSAQVAIGIGMLIWVPAQVAYGVYRHIKFQGVIDAIRARGAIARSIIGGDWARKPETQVTFHYLDGKIVMEESRESAFDDDGGHPKSDDLFARMQEPGQREKMQAAFEATPDELGKAAVKAANERLQPSSSEGSDETRPAK
jgi:hypothetical protein